MNRTILVVDDEQDIRMTLRALFEANGYKVREAENGQVALDMVAEEAPDLIVLDLLMPEVDGYVFLERLPSDQLDSIPIIIFTAKGADNDILRGYAKGAAYYLTKPFENQKMLNATRYLIGDLPEKDRLALEREL
jgi:CheY-like chemotaxis protein